MIDIKHLRQNPQEYKQSAKLRGAEVDIDKLLELDKERSELLVKVEELRAKLNVKGKPTEDQLKELREAKSQLEPLESELDKTTHKYQGLILQVPNLLAENTPEGGEEDNRPEKTWGDASKKEALDHVDLSLKNDWMDFERGAKVAGSKNYFLKGPVVRLEMAVIQMALSLIEEAGFLPITVPHIVTEKTMLGAGFNPRGDEDQIYKIEGEDLNLIATSEIPLTGYHADEIIEPGQLPYLYAGISPSYRKEGGAYGRHNRGFYRVHRFNKVEMYVLCKAQDSEQWHQRLVEVEEKICQLLEIPYQLVRIAAGDLGAPAYKKYDIEYWSPVDGNYRELMSCSNCTDYQSRRMNTRTRTEDGKTELVHTLNGTAMAFSRIYIALLENHQTEDGNVRIPKALQEYFGSDKLV